MDWKEKFTEISFIGVVGFVASWLLKWGKKTIKDYTSGASEIKNLSEVVRRLNEVEEFKLAMMHFNSNPMFIVDDDGSLEYVNPAWCEMTGFKNPDDALGMGYMRAIPERFKDEVIDMNEKAVRHPSTFEGEIIFQHLYDKHLEIKTFC